MNKGQIVSELRNFFTESGCGLGTQRIMNVLETINITERQMAFEKKANCKFTCKEVVNCIRRKGSKSHLLGMIKLGKCQCRDFGSQIASISLNILQYNLLSYVKRFESYETIGGLFREITAQTVELSVTEKIWGLIQQLVSAIADFFRPTSMKS